MDVGVQACCVVYKQIVAVHVAALRYLVIVEDGIFLVAEELQRLRLARGWSASELARATVDVAAEVGEEITLSQQAISSFENKKLKASPRWLRYAQAALALEGLHPEQKAIYLADRFGGYRPLHTAPAPGTLDEEASWVSLHVPLPSEVALAAMFEAQLRVFGDLRGAELARALAKRLPSGLARAQASLSILHQDDPQERLESVEPQMRDRHAAQLAPRR